MTSTTYVQKFCFLYTYANQIQFFVNIECRVDLFSVSSDSSYFEASRNLVLSAMVMSGLKVVYFIFLFYHVINNVILWNWDYKLGLNCRSEWVIILIMMICLVDCCVYSAETRTVRSSAPTGSGSRSKPRPRNSRGRSRGHLYDPRICRGRSRSPFSTPTPIRGRFKKKTKKESSQSNE